MTELNELIYAKAKSGYEKIGVPLKSTSKRSKPGWESRPDPPPPKNLRKQV